MLSRKKQGKSNAEFGPLGTKYSFLLEAFETTRKEQPKELKNLSQQKKMFGKNWIKMNKFNVEQHSSNINYVK